MNGEPSASTSRPRRARCATSDASPDPTRPANRNPSGVGTPSSSAPTRVALTRAVPTFSGRQPPTTHACTLRCVALTQPGLRVPGR